MLPGRTENAIKNYFYSTIRRNLRRYNRKVPDDQQIPGSIGEIIQKPEIVKILMIPSEKKKVQPNFDKSLRKSSRLKDKKECKEDEIVLKIADEDSSLLYSLYETSIEATSKPKITVSSPKSFQLKENISETTNLFESPFLNNFLMAPRSSFVKNSEESQLTINWEQYMTPLAADMLHNNQISISDCYTRSDSVQSYLRNDSVQSYVKTDSYQGNSQFLKQDSLPDSQPLFDITSYLLPHFTPKDTFQHCSEK